MARVKKSADPPVERLTCTADPIWGNRDTGAVHIGECPPEWARINGHPAYDLIDRENRLRRSSSAIVHMRWEGQKPGVLDYLECVDEESGWECLYCGHVFLEYIRYKPGKVVKQTKSKGPTQAFPGKRCVLRRLVSAPTPQPNRWEFRCFEDWETRKMHALYLDGWAIPNPPFDDSAVVLALVLGENLKSTNKVTRKSSPKHRKEKEAVDNGDNGQPS
jgi:hypothetical protein